MDTLLDNRTGKAIDPKTEFSYYKQGDILNFEFYASDSSLSSYSNKNNDTLYKGDVVEIFLDIGDDGYYEFEVAPNGATFIAKIINLEPTFIKNNFFESDVDIIENDYKVKMTIDLAKLKSVKYLKFNAFRIETKGIKQDYILEAYSPTLSNTFHVRDKFVEIPLR